MTDDTNKIVMNVSIKDMNCIDNFIEITQEMFADERMNEDLAEEYSDKLIATLEKE